MILSGAELEQVRQAIRAKALAETKVGFGENIRVAVAIIHTASTPLPQDAVP
jgi:hypothetical protein